MREPPQNPIASKFVHGALVFTGAAGLTLAFFLVLPLIQAISKNPTADTMLQSVDTANIPPPPPPPEPEPEQEDEPEEEPPKLDESPAPLDLSQLELALSAGFGGGWASGDFGMKLESLAGAGKEADALFSLADLDQKPRAVYQPSPTLDAAIRKHTPGTVYVLFVVDVEGKVESPIVQKSTDPVLDRPALAAVKKWKFEPGKRNGQPVRFRMRVPITFPES